MYCRHICECAADDAKISDRLLREMQFIRLHLEKRRAKSGREIKQRDKKKCKPKVFRPHDGFQLLAGVLKNPATSILSNRGSKDSGTPCTSQLQNARDRGTWGASEGHARVRLKTPQ
jgi:hypothetical protein